MTFTLRIAIEVATPDGALLPGQSVRIWNGNRQLENAYRIQMHLAPFLDGELLTVRGPCPDPKPDDRTLLAAPGAFITLTPTRGFEPGLHGWSIPNYKWGRSFEQQPITVADYYQMFEGRKRTALRTTLPKLMTAVQGGLGKVWDITDQRLVSGIINETPFCLGPVEYLLQTAVRIRGWDTRSLEMVPPAALYLHRPGPVREGRVSVAEYRKSFEDFDYMEIEYDGQAGFYPGPNRLELLQFLDRAARSTPREPQGFRDRGPLETA